MKFAITAASFAGALSSVSRVIESRNAYPILANVCLIAEDGRLTMRGTDLDIEVTVGVDAAVEVPGSLTVDAKRLGEMVRKFDKGAEVLVEKTTEHDVIVKSGRFRSSLATLPVDQFPDLKAGAFTHRFTIAGAALSRLISKTSFAISTEETRYYLNGIYLHVVDDHGPMLRAVATDGHRMARCQVEAPDGVAGMPSVIVPRKTVSEIAKLIEKAESVEVDLSDTKIIVRTGNITILSKMIEGVFPDYERVTPKENNNHVVVSKSELTRALDRVSTMASDRGGKAVKLTFADGALKLDVSADSGSASEEIAASTSDAVTIGFNARYLADVLDVVDGDEARLQLKDAGSPTIIRSEGGDGATTFVLMPMRV